MQEKDNHRFLFTTDSAYIIGYITIVGYTMAYYFQKGYFEHYRVPEEFMPDTTINTILLIITVFGPIFLFLTQIIGLYSNSFTKHIKQEHKLLKDKPILFYTMIIFSIYLLGQISYFVGLGKANIENTYTIATNNDKEYIVILREDDNSLVAPFNRKKKILVPRYILLDNKDLTFTKEIINNIKLDENFSKSK
ncbi:hypothetical protein [Rummeliibacillus suwonensis]|uniref:hypothetical protein n=1 Tax=Rummeliibacillus suwonensis TaxID=1306154 RepID=UPI0011B628C1|nr:hypothetical protein [Rummeliibacillus suwonensis]